MSLLRDWRESRAATSPGGAFSQEAAAAEIGVTQGVYADWEAGRKAPRPDGMMKLHRATGISLDALVRAYSSEAGETAA